MLRGVRNAVVGAGVAIMGLAGNALATTPTYTVPEVDYTNVGVAAGSILLGLAFMWGLRKVIKTFNKS